jgi:pimeloyl-ACP methyl ester carboxylesterase
MLEYVIVFILIVLTLLAYMLSKVFKVKAIPHSSTPEDIGVKFSEVQFDARNNLKLYGWLIQHPNGMEKPYIILVHGWMRNLERMMPYIEHLHKNYNLLAFDARNHGSSGKDAYTSMPRFAEDIISAIDYIESISEKPPGIGVLGLSIGGAAAIFAASQDRRIQSIVAVGAFAHPGEVMKNEIINRKIPYVPLGWMLLQYVQLRIKKRFSKIAPVNNIGKTNAKIFLIHGEADTTAPVEHAKRLLQASKSDNTTLWTISGRGHSDCHEQDGFWERVSSFLKNL